jgi:hypothetical protein
MGGKVFLYTMLTVSTSNTRLLHTSVEALDGFKVPTIHIGLTESQFATDTSSNVYVFCEDRRS